MMIDASILTPRGLIMMTLTMGLKRLPPCAANARALSMAIDACAVMVDPAADAADGSIGTAEMRELILSLRSQLDGLDDTPGRCEAAFAICDQLVHAHLCRIMGSSPATVNQLADATSMTAEQVRRSFRDTDPAKRD